MMNRNAKIYVAGHRGMVGSAIVRALERQGYALLQRLLLEKDHNIFLSRETNEERKRNLKV